MTHSLILSSVSSGRNVVVRAVPGAGKSWLLLRCCEAVKHGNVLFLAYNTELAADLSRMVREGRGEEDKDDDRVTCLTLHSLVSRCIRLSHDDAAMEAALTDAEENPSLCTRMDASVVLVDEAQDLSPLHARAIRACVDVSPSTQFVVVGDEMQRIYDYGPHAADPTLFETPSASPFASPSAMPWETFRLSESRRIPPPVSSLVASLFSVQITSHVPTDALSSSPTPPPPVLVHVAARWGLGDVFKEILEGVVRGGRGRWGSVSILSSTKTFNLPLRSGLNALSEAGVPLYVHGVDAPDEAVRANKVRVSSWHASKGTECSVAILLLPPRPARRPLYVAMTRPTTQLHLIALKDEPPDPLLSHVLTSLVASGSLVRFSSGAAECHFAPPPVLSSPPTRFLSEADEEGGRDASAPSYSRRDRSVDLFRDTQSLRGLTSSSQPIRATSAQRVSSSPPPCLTKTSDVDNGEDGNHTVYESVSDALLLAALSKVELERTGRISAMEDCLSPLRLPRDVASVAIRAGVSRRIVTPGTPQESLLHPHLLSKARSAYESLVAERDDGSTASHLCTVACAIQSWSSYQHRMRQRLPSLPWADGDAIERMAASIRRGLEGGGGGSVAFDVRLTFDPNGNEVEDMMEVEDNSLPLLHARAHASGQDEAWCFSDSLESGMAKASLLAALHPKRRCRVVRVLGREEADEDSSVVVEYATEEERREAIRVMVG